MPRENITREATIGQLLDEIVDRIPDQDAVVYADRDYRQTWREFRETVDKAAKGLMALGVKKGDKVAVWATNVPHWVTLQFATARIGAILLTININYRHAEIDYLLKQSDCENIFVIDGYRDTDYVNTLYELIPELKTQPRDRLRSERYPAPAAGAVPGTGEAPRHVLLERTAGHERAVGDDGVPGRGRASCPRYDVVNMQYTSGTTGFPKGVMLTHFNIANNGYWIGVERELHHRRPGLHSRSAVPLLRLRAGGHGLPEPRGDHGHPGDSTTRST